MTSHCIEKEQMPLTRTCALRAHTSSWHSFIVSNSQDEASCTERTADSASDAAGQSSAPAAAPAAPPAQGNPSTQWEGPDQTKDTTTVMVCLADGTRQVRPPSSPDVPDASVLGKYCLSLLSFVLRNLHGTSRQHEVLGGAAGPVQAISTHGSDEREATGMHKLSALPSSRRRCNST